MRLNGLFIVLDLAERKLNHPLVSRYQQALILGSIREDVWYIPGIKRVIEHLSFTHFYNPSLPGGIIPFLWPGPRLKANLFYGRALRAYRQGDTAGAFVQLGRVAHLITDMSCPVHVHRTVHETDPFEWWVEGNRKTLLGLEVPALVEGRRASDFIEGLARYTLAFRTDATNHLPGRILRKLGVLKPVTAREAGEQAKALIPLAAAYTASMLRLFLREVGAEVGVVGAAGVGVAS
jgi:hypothetical protein